MTIRTSIYDFFAYAVPGGLFLLNLFIFLNFVNVPFNISNKYLPSEFSIIAVFVLLSYVFGHLTSSINSRWTKIFEPRLISTVAMNEFKKLHPNIEIEIEPNDWQIWFASIRRESEDLKLEIDRMMATSYFLRGVSLNLVVLAIILVVGVINGKLLIWTLIGIPFILLFSYISVRESIKFNKWFYFLIYEIVISRKDPFSTNISNDIKKTKGDKE